MASRAPGVFHLRLEEGGAEVLVVADRIDDRRWSIERLDFAGIDELRSTRLTLEERRVFSRLETLAAADVDGDGARDLVALWSGAISKSYIGVYLANGRGGYEAAELFESERAIGELVTGDFDGEGVDEIAFLYTEDDFEIHVYALAGAGGLELVTTLFEWKPVHLVSLDVDDDGADELIYVSRPPRPGSRPLVTRFSNEEGYLAGAHELLPACDAPTALFVRRHAASGRAEVVAIDRTPHAPDLPLTRVFAWEGGVEARPLSTQWQRAGLLWKRNTIRSFDADEDGIGDLVFKNTPSLSSDVGSGLTLLRGLELGGYELVHRSFGLPELVDMMRLDGDELPDLVVMGEGGSFSRYPARAMGGFYEPDAFAEHGYGNVLNSKVGDLDDDGLDDLLVRTIDTSTGEGRLDWLRSRGDGSFERSTYGDRPYPRIRVLEDLDADGFTDIAISEYMPEVQQRILLVDWGEGGAPDWNWRPALLDFPLGDDALGDLDGDGDVDIAAATLRGSTLQSGFDLSLFLLEGRVFRLADASMLPMRPSGVVRYGVSAGDVDGDGTSEIVYFEPIDEGFRQGRLVRREVVAEARLGAPEALPFRALSMEYGFVLEDVDADGDDDVILIERSNGERPLTVLESRGSEPMRVLFNGLRFKGPVPDLFFADVDQDGFVDVVEAGKRDAFELWLGDGSGGFEALGKGFFLSRSGGSTIPPRAHMAALDGHAGLDYVRPEGFHALIGSGVRVELQRTPQLSFDTAPPTLSAHAWPEIDGFESMRRFEGQWRLTGIAKDECTSARVTRLFVEIPPMEGLPLTWRAGASYAVRLFESRDGEPASVVLVGPAELVARELFARMLAAGGFELAPNSFLGLFVRDEWGPSAEELREPASGLLSHEWSFEGDALVGIGVQRPEGDIRFLVEAEDATGKRATTRGSFVALRRAYCESEAAAELVCAD